MKYQSNWEDIYDPLAAEYPNAKCSLTHRNAFELLVATVLSAQTTDARVNTVTPSLFSNWPTPSALASAKEEDVQTMVRPLGFQRRRAAQLVQLARKLCEDFAGSVPQQRTQLTSLPGVGRKTAHVVLGNCFGKPALTVDTHVGRLSRRIGLTEETNPLKVERDLASFFPAQVWTQLSHLLIFHGRAVCQAKSPDCAACVLRQVCAQNL